MPSNPSRRRLLEAASAAIPTAVAGCIGRGVTPPGSDGTAAQVTCADADDSGPGGWPTYGYDVQNTAANPNATGPRTDPEVRWTEGRLGGLWGAPVVAEQTVYVQETPTRLTAFDRATGEQRWSVSLGRLADSETARVLSGPHSTPAVVGDTVYVGGGYVAVRDGDGLESERVANRVRLYAIDRGTGEIRWTVRPDHLVATAPVAVGDRVLFATVSGTVYAVDTEREAVAWRFADESLAGPLATPAVEGCRLYLATAETGLYAFDARRGELDWNLSGADSRAPPAVADGTVYVARADGAVSALDAADGAVEWTRDLGRAFSTASPAVAGGTVFVGDADGEAGEERQRIHALDAATGGEVWSASTTEYVNSSPAVADGVVVVAARDRIRGFDAATGERLWFHEVSGAVRAPLSVAGETVFAGTLHGRLYALAGAE